MINLTRAGSWSLFAFKIIIMVTAILGRIHSLRIEKNISQQCIADHLNITQSSYAKIENGTTKLSLDALFKICALMQINPAVFFELQTKNDSQSLLINIKDELLEIKKMMIENGSE